MLEGIGREYTSDFFGADIGLKLHLENMRHAAHCGTMMIPALLMNNCTVGAAFQVKALIL